MQFNYDILDNTEKIGYALLSLYAEYGFCKYRMSKFEEYDFYSKNKDFLLSDNIITFTDTTGKLMALKPDVTLSIIKNNKDMPSELKKLSYKENVYRVPRNGSSFKEIMQVGLECIGNVDISCISEVLKLAAESLKVTERDYVLEISHLDILSAFIDSLNADYEVKQRILKCAGEKNLHEINEICESNEIDKAKADALKQLLALNGKATEVLPKLESLSGGIDIWKEVALLKETISRSGLDEERINIDFSIVSDMNYYNGIVFRGYVDGVPSSVLSGGQYDKLMKKMDRKSKAIGFAVYLDAMQRV